MEERKAIAVFTKDPGANISKTRLVPPLTPGQSEELAGSLLEETLSIIKRTHNYTDMILCFYPGSSIEYFRKKSNGRWLLQVQKGNSPCKRFDRVFESNISGGFQKLVVIGSDTPTLPAYLLDMAALELEDHEAVIGPSNDGGFYLLGLSSYRPAVFDNIAWGTSSALSDIIRNLKKEKIPYATLPKWYDIDNIDDLFLLISHLKFLPGSEFKDLRRTISNIITNNDYFSKRASVCRV